MGLTMKEKQAVTREYKPRYQKASNKRKTGFACRICQGINLFIVSKNVSRRLFRLRRAYSMSVKVCCLSMM